LNDELTTDASITYGGTLNAVNVGASLLPGQSFKLFSAASYSGAFGSIVPATPGSGLTWDTSQLTVDGTISVQGILIGSVVHNGSNLEFNGGGGTPGATYHVLSSTNAALPLINWDPILTNMFDGSGNFSFTNAVNPDLTGEYFSVQEQP
jgi:hypothetical protein